MSEPSETECVMTACDQTAVTVLSYSTCPHRDFPLCAEDRPEALAWIRGRWGAEVTITETPIQPPLLTREEAGDPC